VLYITPDFPSGMFTVVRTLVNSHSQAMTCET
jgi:hypothetical protein